MYQVRLSDEALKAYNKLKRRSSDLAKVNRGLEIIEQAPFFYPGHVIPLKRPLTGKYRCRISEWRIIYTVSRTDRVVNVETIIKRDESTY
jgi:mRNA-degrading endonuclease RelE of RelBE toxin-antitoxin system